MNIGQYKLTALETGRFALDGGAMFGIIPKNLWAKRIPADEQNRIPLALRCLLVCSDNHKILIDTGIGEKFEPKWQEIYHIDLSGRSLVRLLSDNDLDPQDITDVVLSHLHFDHCGGTTFIEKNQVRLRFPNARHHIQKQQWQWAQHPSNKDKASYLNENYSLIFESGILNLVEGDTEILPGIQTVQLNGHTPGMQGVKITGDGKTVFYCADLVPTASHIPLPWIMAYDNEPLVTLAEKQDLMPRACNEGWILFFEHDPFYCAARIVQDDRGFSASNLLTTDQFNNFGQEN